MEDKDVFILEEIISYCDKIAAVLAKHSGGFDEFDADSEYQDVCVFRVMQIGEYVNSLSEKFKKI